ncbi:MAG: hypothetical protein NTU94_08870 [Planctomycetota bacterium]|nr:hypothetical protein [Planctomycetota bacterium]
MTRRQSIMGVGTLVCLLVFGFSACQVKHPGALPPNGEAVVSHVEAGQASGRAIAKSDWDKVMQFYQLGAGAVFEGLYAVPLDTELIKRSPDELLAWLEVRERQANDPAAPEPVKTHPAARHSDLARVYRVLLEKDRTRREGAPLFRQRLAVLAQALDVMRVSGDGPAGALALQIQALAEDYPGRSEVGVLHVDLFCALTAVAENAAEDFARITAQSDTEAFVARVSEQAKEVEHERLAKICKRLPDEPAGHIAAIYLIRYEWDRGKEGREQALALLAKHRAAIAGNGAWESRAARIIGDILATTEGLTDLEFADTKGRKWKVDDLKGRITLFCFYIPAQRDMPGRWHNKLGSKVQIIAVPAWMDETESPGSGAIVSVDPKRSDVSLLRQKLRVIAIPENIIVTPFLEVISDPEKVFEYLRSQFPEIYGAKAG